MINYNNQKHIEIKTAYRFVFVTFLFIYAGMCHSSGSVNVILLPDPYSCHQAGIEFQTNEKNTLGLLGRLDCFSVSAKFSPPYSLLNNVDYSALKDEREENQAIISDPTLPASERTAAGNRIAEIDQERFNWLEFYKINFKGDWFTQITQKLILKPS